MQQQHSSGSSGSESFIQKRLLYRFDKKIEQLFEEYYSQFYPNPTSFNNSQMVDESNQSKQNNQNKNEGSLHHQHQHQQSNESHKMTREEFLNEIEQLEFQNFKYRTSLISAQKDQLSNETILTETENSIQMTRQEVKVLEGQLEKALLKKKNKEEYNKLAMDLKSYEVKTKQDKQIEEVAKEIAQMEENYLKEMEQYTKKEKCVRHALSALKCFLEMDGLGLDETAAVESQGNGIGIGIGGGLNGSTPLRTVAAEGEVSKRKGKEIDAQYENSIDLESQEGLIMY